MSGEVPQNPNRILGLELYDQTQKGDRKSGWIAVSYDFDDGGYWIQFEHSKFAPYDIKLNRLEIVIDLARGLEYVREK